MFLDICLRRKQSYGSQKMKKQNANEELRVFINHNGSSIIVREKSLNSFREL